jgi:threonine aldolase
LADIEAAIKPDDAHFARTRLLCLENTFGGSVLGLDYLRQATELARRHGLATHLDGARLFNAAVALANGGDARAKAREMAQLFDSVSVCFSKGLGAPIGSTLVGSRELIARAHRTRKMLGGGLRQVGVLAAAALHALDHHIDRLADDHANARRLADGLRGADGVASAPAQTNMVFVDLVPDRGSRADTVGRLRERGLLCTGIYKLRLVTHLDVSRVDIDRAVTILRETL